MCGLWEAFGGSTGQSASPTLRLSPSAPWPVHCSPPSSPSTPVIIRKPSPRALSCCAVPCCCCEQTRSNLRRQAVCQYPAPNPPDQRQPLPERPVLQAATRRCPTSCSWAATSASAPPPATSRNALLHARRTEPAGGGRVHCYAALALALLRLCLCLPLGICNIRMPLAMAVCCCLSYSSLAKPRRLPSLCALQRPVLCAG